MLVSVLGIGLLIAGVVFALMLYLTRALFAEKRLLAVTQTAREAAPETGLLAEGGASRVASERLLEQVAQWRALLGGKASPELRRRLALAGYRQQRQAEVFLAARLVLPLLLILLVSLLAREMNFLYLVLAGLGGYFAPEMWLNQAIVARRERIRLSLPDALDLLAICVEAGLGLDQAVLRVSQELALSHPDLAQELLQVHHEQRAGKPRLEAWRQLAERVPVSSIQSFVNMLVQTDRFGTPISRTLNVFSEALRTQRRQQAEELAAKTTIKLVFPLVLFIFPSIFIVTAVPAIITLMKGFSRLH